MLLRRAACALAAALAIGGALFTVPPTASATDASPTLELLRQSPSVTPTTPGGPTPFEVSVKVDGALPAGAELGLSFYSKLSTRGAFEQTLTGAPTGLMQTVAPQPVSSLSPAPGGGFQINATIVAGSPQPAGSDTVDLRGTTGSRCVVGNGSCSGVYPVVVQLFGADGTVVAHLTTYLTYAEERSSVPLLFSWVVPVSAPLRLRPSGSLDGAVAAPAAGQVRNLAELVAALIQSPSVSATVAPSPITVEALENNPSKADQEVLAGLRTLAASPTHHLLAEPFVPVNLSSLSAAGVTTEIVGQTRGAQTVLDRVVDGLPAADQPDTDVWLDAGPVGSALGQGLRLAGSSTVVLPDTDLPPESEQHFATWAQPFRLSTGRGADLTAAVSDSQLSSYFSAKHGDPVLAANQLLADLAMIQSELPGAHATRGVIAVPPYGWNPNPKFVAALLAGLANNPVVSTVTLPQFFTSVPVGGNDASTTRHLNSGESGERISPAHATSIVAARRQITGFDRAVEGNPVVETQLGNLLLASESSQLSQSEQRNGIALFEKQLAGVLGAIQVLRNTVTLTARTASIPITVVSSADYRLNAKLTLSSEKLQFPQGLTRKVHIDHPTNSTTVEVRARTTGDLPLEFTLTSPDGSLVIAKGRLTVRSTATSIVGIVLTLVAAVVLLGWWARTWRRGRAQRHGRVTRVTP